MNLDTCNMAYNITKMHKHYDMQQIGEDVTHQKDFLKFRKDFLQEEIDELTLAIDSNDADDVVDSIINLLFVGITTLDLLGVDVNKAWKEVFGCEHEQDLANPDDCVVSNHIDNLGVMKDWIKNDK